jgi:hypothetical protein
MFHREILPALKNYAEVFYPDGAKRLTDAEVLALAHRMGSLIMSYSFELDKDEDEEDAEADDDNAQDGWIEDHDTQTLAMLPMADILNADAEFNVSPTLALWPKNTGINRMLRPMWTIRAR